VPFTLSHPAAVLPFLRTGLPASALVAGSTVPDLPYYLPVDLGVRTHTAPALVTVDLAGGLLLWALWHGVLAAPVVAGAPAALRARLGAVRTGLPVAGLRGAAGVVGGVLLGAGTHVLWDEFTHPGRWGTRHLAFLADDAGGRPGWSWAQETSSLVGGVVVLGWLVLWWRRAPVRPVPARRPWAWVLVAAIAVVAGAAGAAGQPDLRSVAVLAAFTGGTAALVTTVVLALGWHVRRRVSSG
jgi:hypothetical protein